MACFRALYAHHDSVWMEKVGDCGSLAEELGV
jgi:hypothetical protein